MTTTLVHTWKQIKIFASLLYEPSDVVEIRLLPVGESIWVTADQLHSKTASLIRQNAQGQNVYIGANPRRTKGGRAAKDVKLARCLFADFDNNADYESVMERLAQTEFPDPTLALNSGHGIHMYWRLIEPMMDLSIWTQFQKRLIHLMGSDPKPHDAPRIMRLPGFINHKEPAAMAELLEVNPSV